MQTPSARLFLIGGGDNNRPELKSLTACIEILNNNTSQLDALAKDSMKHPRHGHACTVLKDKFIVVTGSRIEKDGANRSVESYNIDMDLWFDYPQLNFGRHYHSCCSFEDSWVYVFAGIASQTKKYFSSIERLNIEAKGSEKKWEIIEVPISFTPRQGAGSAQFNSKELLIFGGFGGDFMKDVFVFDHQSKQMKPQ